jgi:hypothetical protein
MMKDNEEQQKLIESLFLKMGASEKKARTMASQLLKRACQIANEQEITVIEAVERLLKQILEAREK